MASLADTDSDREDGDDHQADVFLPSNHGKGSILLRDDGDELFERADGKNLLINWSGSFEGFGSAQGTRFPTQWVPTFKLDFDGEGDEHHDALFADR